MSLILKVKNLNVTLDGEEIIKGLSFEVKKGEILTVLGPNGAGKTVLLKTLLGIFPYKGEIQWQKDIRIGYVPQRLPFIKEIPMNIKDFFRLKNVQKEEAKRTLSLVGFKEGFLNKRIGDLSSGQFQRVLIAWGLVKNPNVLLFDEPTTGVDILGEETIYSLLSELRREKKLTIILVTHDLSVVYKFSDYVVCLNRCSVCQGKPRDVLTVDGLRNLYGSEIKFYQHKESSG